MEATSNYTTDGKEATNHMGPREVKATVVWDGPKLVVNAKTTYQDAELGIKSIWVLSDDGKTLTQNVHYQHPDGRGRSDLDLRQTGRRRSDRRSPRRYRCQSHAASGYGHAGQPPVSSPISAGHGSWMSRNPTLAFFRLTTAAPT